MHDLQPLRADLDADPRRSSEVRARAVETSYQPSLHRIVADIENYRDAAGRRLCRKGRGRAARDDDVHVLSCKLDGQRGQLFRISICPAVFDLNIPAVDI